MNILEYNNLINSIQNLVTPGIYGLEDTQSKAIWIGRSTNILKSIGILVTNVVENNHVCSGMNVKPVLLEIGDCSALRQSIIRQKYLDMGYTILNKRSPIEYRIVTECRYFTGKVLLALVLVTKRRKKTVVGLFESKELLDEFSNKYYCNGVTSIVYSDNEWSKKYLKNE